MWGWLGTNSRRTLIILHDLAATAAAVLASFYIRFETPGLEDRFWVLVAFLPGFVVYAGFVYHFLHLYKAKWRFASLPDLMNIFRAASVLAVSLLVLDYIILVPSLYGGFFFGKITIVLYWLLQMFFLGGPRLVYRYFRYTRDRQHNLTNGSVATLILGRAADAEMLLRAIESGAVRKIRPVGILSPSPADQGQALRGVPVRGQLDHLERVAADLAAGGTPVGRVVVTASALEPSSHPEAILMQARRLGISISRMPSLEEDGGAPRLAPVKVEDLLLRPTAKIDYERLEEFVRGKSVVVTGGGGSIGAEICRRVMNFGAARLLILENSEPALHAIIEDLASFGSKAVVEGRIADIRDRARMFDLITSFRPDVVFHAAALKHVPLLERDWIEGVRTNVLGSVNVADASIAAKASAMVLISTDKAIAPVSVLGVTKRLAEMYCQAMDAEAARVGGESGASIRLIAVRFGNVLASNGSVVPRFKAQIEAGGPVTVTHPDMVRYFMTIREACDLVITASSHALGPRPSDASIYVLNMGQPVKIVELAERMIRLSGYEPGRDIDIVFTGIRPGERLSEALFAQEEPTAEIGIPGIVAAKPVSVSPKAVKTWLDCIEKGFAQKDADAVRRVLQQAAPDFKGEAA